MPERGFLESCLVASLSELYLSMPIIRKSVKNKAGLSIEKAAEWQPFLLPGRSKSGRLIQLPALSLPVHQDSVSGHLRPPMDRWMVKPIRQTPRRLLRGHARSHRALLIAKAWLILQCNHRWQDQLLQVSRKSSANGDPVGAESHAQKSQSEETSPTPTGGVRHTQLHVPGLDLPV